MIRLPPQGKPRDQLTGSPRRQRTRPHGDRTTVSPADDLTRGRPRPITARSDPTRSGNHKENRPGLQAKRIVAHRNHGLYGTCRRKARQGPGKPSRTGSGPDPAEDTAHAERSPRPRRAQAGRDGPITITEPLFFSLPLSPGGPQRRGFSCAAIDPLYRNRSALSQSIRFATADPPWFVDTRPPSVSSQSIRFATADPPAAIQST
ncbi:hypothetical protein Uis1B_0900 [Bifidobacterium margollesii]|uniref:Uncharacterized protein n=1 Tax=Bifidobacterium margollesii TaxID=2020964 RepID=A0A2N5JAL9_9BIFI|nr:hypothetical protein Uis1B_0900 [Bifidobacterium margollesii]